jgi:DNA invertase Pin-like site-specific DNA recombinase
VSTDDQTTENQQAALLRAADARSWQIVQVFTDQATSGAKPHHKRPGLSAALTAATRREYQILAVWDLSRLGRSLTDLIDFTTKLHATGTDLFVLNQQIDTTTPAGRLTFHIFGAFAEFERDMIITRTRAARDRARQANPYASPDDLHGAGKPLGGKAPVPLHVETHALQMLIRSQQLGRSDPDYRSHRDIAAELGIAPSTVHRIGQSHTIT